MNKVLKAFMLISLISLWGCNGLSGENDSSTTSIDTDATTTVTDAVETSLTLSILNDNDEEQISFTEDSIITVRAKLLDQDGLAITESRINFSADLGELSPASSLTNSEGIAEAQISNPDKTLSAGTLTASISTTSETIDYEFIDSNAEELSNKLSMQLLLNGSQTNQFRTDESVQVQVHLLDSNDDPISNEIINYTTSLGEFEIGNQSALTSDTGHATLTLYPSNDSVAVVGAGIVRVYLNSDSTISENMNFQIVSADSVTEQIRIGYFTGVSDVDTGEGKLNLSTGSNAISAGGTTRVTAELIDSTGTKVTTPVQVSFTSNCVLNERASIDLTVLSNNGIAEATYEDISCAGVTGTDDLITATVDLADGPIIATGELSIMGESLGSINFVSADPENIFLKGTGKQENSTLTFLVKGALGNPLAHQEVSFELNTESNGLGITLSRNSGFTNSQGLITTQVSSGYTPIVVNVTASATSNSETIKGESDSLTATTGLPHQSGFSISAETLNPTADTFGTTSTIHAWLTDSFGNQVADGTAINFTTEGGSIVSSCTTVDGHCDVDWTATGTVPADRRSTILATTNGHETFYDTNGNNIFDADDGAAISLTNIPADSDADTLKSVYSGFGSQTPLSEGFLDLPEAWRDDNENGVKDPVETKYFDQNNSGDYTDIGDAKFTGPQCDEENDSCSDTNIAILRKSLVIVMSSSTPAYILSNIDTGDIYQESDGQTVTTPTAFPDIADGDTLALRFQFASSVDAGEEVQVLPEFTELSVSASSGELSGSTSYIVGRSTRSGYRNMDFSITNTAGGDPDTSLLTISIDTPNRAETIYVSKAITLN